MKRRIFFSGLASLLLLAVWAGAWWYLLGNTGGAASVRTGIARASSASQTGPGYPEPVRDRQAPDPQAEPDAPQISFIDSPSATCYRPMPETDACYISWNYLNVSAGSSAYIISMTVRIDGQLRANYQGFFQNAMYVPYDLNPLGFRVACGAPGSSSDPKMGKAYSYVIRARDTMGLKSANYGTVLCPADVVPPKSVMLTGAAAGRPGTGYEFSAAVEPITTTLPVTYSWRASGQTPITQTSGLTATQIFTWSSLGDKQVTVEAGNPAGSVVVTHTIQIRAPITGLAASNDGPTPAGASTQLAATVSGGSGISYTWDLGDGASANGATVTHTYPGAGPYTATVTATNGISIQQAETVVLVVERVFLPLVSQ